jgi:tetratricopeptide (TPR) repeat protein
MLILAALLTVTLGVHSDSVSVRDSIFKHFMSEGAWRQPLHSHERERYIDSALALLPHDAYLWHQRGMPLWKARKYDLALRYTDSAVKYDSSQWIDYRGFCNCIFAKRYPDAIRDLRIAKRLNGDRYVMDHPVEFYLALSFLQLNDFDSAKRYMDRTIAIDTSGHGAAGLHYLHEFYYGIVAYEREDYPAALRWFDLALGFYPRFSDAEYYKALTLKKRGESKTADRLLHDAAADFNAGFTINEDNAIYESYPYQLTASTIRPYLGVANP